MRIKLNHICEKLKFPSSLNNIYGVMRNNERINKGLLYKTNEYFEARELEIKDASSGSSDCFVSDACLGGNDFAEASPS